MLGVRPIAVGPPHCWGSHPRCPESAPLLGAHSITMGPPHCWGSAPLLGVPSPLLGVLPIAGCPSHCCGSAPLLRVPSPLLGVRPIAWGPPHCWGSTPLLGVHPITMGLPHCCGSAPLLWVGPTVVSPAAHSPTRQWGHSVSSPTLLDPTEPPPAPHKVCGAHTVGSLGSPRPTDGRLSPQDGRSHWGRVKVLLNRFTRRSLRGR